jgi:circadian clock protein KaiC
MQRVETKIPGLDEMLDGGLPKGSSTIVVGGCGSGKTTLSLQYLYNGARDYDENGVYVSFNETPDMLTQYMSQYGWNLEDLERRGNLSILRLDPADVASTHPTSCRS